MDRQHFYKFLCLYTRCQTDSYWSY